MKLILSSLLLLFGTVSFGQATKTDPVDGQAWYGAGVKFDLPKKWNVNVDYEARFQNNMKDFNGSYYSLSAEKKLNKYFSLLAEYRLSVFDDGKYHRFSFGGSAEKKLAKKFNMNARLLFLNKIWDDIDTSVANEKTYWCRFRLGGDYSITKKLTAYASVEPFYEFGGSNLMDNCRNTLGLKYKIAKNTKLDVFYIYRPDYHKATYNRYYNIVGVNVKYSIKVKSKK